MSINSICTHLLDRSSRDWNFLDMSYEEFFNRHYIDSYMEQEPFEFKLLEDGEWHNCWDLDDLWSEVIARYTKKFLELHPEDSSDQDT